MTNAPPNNTTNQTVDAAVTPTQEPTPETLGQFVARLRTQRQLSRERLAEAMLVPVSVVVGMEDLRAGEVVPPPLLSRLRRALAYFGPITEADRLLMDGWEKTCRRSTDMQLFTRLAKRADATAQTLRELKYKLSIMHLRADSEIGPDMARLLHRLANNMTGCHCLREFGCTCPDKKQPKVPAFDVAPEKWHSREVWQAMDRAFDTSEDMWERRGRWRQTMKRSGIS